MVRQQTLKTQIMQEQTWILDEMNVDESSDHEEGPVRYRSINDVYQDSVEVELTSDVEMEALLAVMEEPSSYQDAAGSC